MVWECLGREAREHHWPHFAAPVTPGWSGTGMNIAFPPLAHLCLCRVGQGGRGAGALRGRAGGDRASGACRWGSFRGLSSQLLKRQGYFCDFARMSRSVAAAGAGPLRQVRVSPQIPGASLSCLLRVSRRLRRKTNPTSLAGHFAPLPHPARFGHTMPLSFQTLADRTE